MLLLGISTIWLYSKNRIKINRNQEIEYEAIEHVQIYQYDIDEHFRIEFIELKEFYERLKDESGEFHNIKIILRIYLVFMIANSRSERSFSNLKRIKKRLRTLKIFLVVLYK